MISLFHMHLTPTKGSSQTTGHTKESSEAKHQKAGLPSLPPPLGAVRGHQVAIAHAQASAKYFTACFLFSVFYFLCTNGKMHQAKQPHLGPSAPHRDVTSLPAGPQPLPQKDTLIPHAFLFISCLSWRQKYWVLVSLSDFKEERKG